MTDVTRVVCRRANLGCDQAYADLVKGMLSACATFPGYLFSTVIPPKTEGDQFHIIQKCASQTELDAWTRSKEADDWHARLLEVSHHEPEYRLFGSSDLWFSAAPRLVGKPPARWRLAIVTWIGIFPTVCAYVGLLLPYLFDVPFIPKMAIVTILIVATMHYVVMPNLLRRMDWWLKG